MTPATTPNRERWYLPTIDDKHAQKFEAVTILRREKHDNDTWEWRSNGDIEILAERILECSRTFTATYGGERITLEAGTSRVCSDHELARSHPHHFRPARSLKDLTARAVRAPAPVKPSKPSAAAPKRWPAGYLPPKRPENAHARELWRRAAHQEA